MVTGSDTKFMGSCKLRTIPLYGIKNPTLVVSLHLFSEATSVSY